MLEHIARRLDQAGITWAIFAGAAAHVYGANRPLTDIDILIPSSKGEQLLALFPQAQVIRGPDDSVAGVQLPGFDILAGLNIMDLDAPMAVRLTHHEIAGVMVPVIPPEDNTLFKAILGRGPEVGKHDWEDIRAMLAHLPTLDWEYLRWRAGACGVEEQLLQRIQDEEQAIRRKQ
jgi:hypothetical protein